MPRPLTSLRSSALFGLLLSCLACSSGAGGSGGSGRSTEAPPGSVLDLARRSNDLLREYDEALCAVCPCGAFLDVSAEAEACYASVLDEYPHLRPAVVEQLQCLIAATENRLTCLASASDCDQSTACRDAGDRCDANLDEEIEAAFTAEVQRRCGDL
jgi:hypothetical protein